MEQTFNKTIKIETYDVADIQKNWRIVYFPEQHEMIVTKSLDKAELARLKEKDKSGIILTRRQAPRSFPTVFSDSTAKPVNLTHRTVIVKVSQQQYAFMAKFGNVSAYLRMLIDGQMKTAKKVSV